MIVVVVIVVVAAAFAAIAVEIPLVEVANPAIAFHPDPTVGIVLFVDGLVMALVIKWLVNFSLRRRR